MKVPFTIEDLGIEFSRFSARDFELHCATWRDDANSHIYSVRVSHAPYGWLAVLENDGREVGRVSAATKASCADLALGAMKAYLVRGHRKALRTLRRDAEEAYAACHPYETVLLEACEFDINLAHAVESVAIRRCYTADRLRGVNFAKILEMMVTFVASSNTPAITEGGAE